MGKYKEYIVSLLGLALLVLIFPYVADYFLNIRGLGPHHEPGLHHGQGMHIRRVFKMDNVMHFFMTIIVALIPLLIHLYKNWIEASRAKTEMELSFLKSQINHHFLFNALNSIYVQSIQGKPQTSDSIHSLSFIMRYILDESQKQRTLLSKELEYIHHYIELQRLRLNEKVTLNYKVIGEPNELYIAPMMLIPFIENCFKHGISVVQSCTISIEIHIDGDNVVLNAKNDIVESTNQSKTESGIGLVNVKRRLEFEYFNAYKLETGKQGNHYITVLNLLLK